jgi:outer membrane protein assembly factor BamB
MKKHCTGVSIVLLLATMAVCEERRTLMQEVRYHMLRSAKAVGNEVGSWMKGARHGIRSAGRGVADGYNSVIEGGRRGMDDLRHTTVDLGRRAKASAKMIVDETVFQLAGPVGTESAAKVIVKAGGQVQSPILHPLFLKTYDIVLAWSLDTGGKPMRRSLILDRALVVEDTAKSIYSFRPDNGIVQWIYPIPAPSQCPLKANKRSIFVVAADMVFEIDRTVGRPRYKFEFPSPIGSPAAFNDTNVVAASWDRRIYSINRETRVREWTYLPTASVEAGVVLAPNMAYIPDVEGKLVAYSPPDRSTEWTYKAQDAIRVPITRAGHHLVFPADDLYLHCVNRFGGYRNWRFPLNGRVREPAWVTKERVYFSSEGDGFYAITRDKGEVIWRVPNGGWPVAVGNSAVYIEGPDAEIWSIDLKTGERLWRVSREPFAQVFRNTLTDRIHLCSARGELYTLYLRGDHLRKGEPKEKDIEPEPAKKPAAPEPGAATPRVTPDITPPAGPAEGEAPRKPAVPLIEEEEK